VEKIYDKKVAVICPLETLKEKNKIKVLDNLESDF